MKDKGTIRIEVISNVFRDIAFNVASEFQLEHQFRPTKRARGLEHPGIPGPGLKLDTVPSDEKHFILASDLVIFIDSCLTFELSQAANQILS